MIITIRQLIPVFVFVLLVAVCTSVSARIITGQSLEKSEALSKNAAIFDLSSVITGVVRNRLYRNTLNDEEIMLSENLPISGIQIRTVKKGQKFSTKASINEANLLKTAQLESKKHIKRINFIISSISSLRSTPEKQEAFNSLENSIDRYKHFNLINRSLSNSSGQLLAQPYSQLVNQLARSLPSHQSYKKAIIKIIKNLNTGGKKQLFVYAPTLDNTSKITPVSALIKERIVETLNKANQVSSIMLASHYLMGKYRIIDDKVLIILHLRDKLHNTIKTESALFQMPDSFKNIQSPNNKLAETIHRGLVKISSNNTDIKYTKNINMKFDNDFRVDIRTQQGHQNLHYRLGSTGKLYIKMTMPGYFYIIGHVSKPNKRYSYLLQLSNNPGNERFIYVIDKDSAHQWIELGEFDIDPPLGVEALQVIASTESPIQLLPTSQYDISSGLYLVGNEPEKTAATTRGLVRVKMNKIQQNNAKNIATGANFAESSLHFTTLGKN